MRLGDPSLALLKYDAEGAHRSGEGDGGAKRPGLTNTSLQILHPVLERAGLVEVDLALLALALLFRVPVLVNATREATPRRAIRAPLD